MKNLRRLAGISILFTLVFMVIALFNYQNGEHITILPDQMEYYYEGYSSYFPYCKGGGCRQGTWT